MRRLSLVFLVLLAVAACAKSPAGPNARHDPYWGGVLDARSLTRFPDSALIVVQNYVLRPSDSLPMYDTTTIRKQRGGLFISERCGGFSAGAGFVGDYLIRADIFVIVGRRDSLSTYAAGSDTIARYTVGVWNPLLSPFLGWGDDPDHAVIWRITLTDATPVATVPILPTAERQNPVGDINWGQHCNSQS